MNCGSHLAAVDCDDSKTCGVCIFKGGDLLALAGVDLAALLDGVGCMLGLQLDLIAGVTVHAMQDVLGFLIQGGDDAADGELGEAFASGETGECAELVEVAAEDHGLLLAEDVEELGALGFGFFAGVEMPCGACAVGDDGWVDDDEEVFGGAFGGDGFEPFEAGFVVGIEESELGVAMGHGMICLGVGGAGIELAGLLGHEGEEDFVEGFLGAVAGDVVVAFGEDKGDAELCLGDEGEGFAVLAGGKFGGAAEAFDEVAYLENEGGRGGGVAQGGDALFERGEHAGHDLGGETGVVIDLAEVAAVVGVEPLHVVVREAVVVEVAEEDEGEGLGGVCGGETEGWQSGGGAGLEEAAAGGHAAKT